MTRIGNIYSWINISTKSVEEPQINDMRYLTFLILRVSSKHQKYLEKRNQVAKLSQFKTPTKFAYRYDFDFIRSYYEPLGLTEREFFEGLVIEKNGIFVDTLSSEKIVISFLQESGYSDDIRKISYTYFKKNGVITEEKVKCETLKK